MKKFSLLLIVCLFFHLDVFAQEEIIVEGKITDPKGFPIPGVNVIEKNTSNGVVTNFDGEYSIVLPSQAVIVFSYLGHATVEREVNGQSKINISMDPEASSLDEVVVVGYGTQRRQDLTGSISSVNMEDISSPSVASFDQMLQGQAAGVQVSQTSGAPGGNVNILVRGVSSITGGNQPLYVVDGFPIGGSGTGSDFSNRGGTLYTSEGLANNTQNRINPLASINPADIASIEILKDASATAIYGSRGANGVVIITTKRGQFGKTEITVDASYGMQSVANKLDMLNSQQYAEYVAEGRDNAYVLSGGSPSDPNELRPASQRVPEGFRNPSSITTDTDWQDVIFRIAPVSNYQVSVNTGNEKTRVYFSGGYFSQEGIIHTSNYERFNLRTNLDSEITDRLKIGSSITGSYGYGSFPNVEGHYGTGGVLGQALSASPTIPVYNEKGEPYFNQEDVTNGLGWLQNPLNLLSGFSDNRKSSTILWNNYLEYEILEGLNFRSTLGLQHDTQAIKIWRSSAIPNYTALDVPATAGATKSTSLNWLNENTLNYNRLIDNTHRIDALIGFTAQKDSYERLSAGASDFPTENVTYLSGGIVNAGTHILSEWSLLSLMGRINYSYDSKYLFTATVRRDGSSRFGSNNKWGTFPSFSFGYNIAEENFMDSFDVINNLKLRTSYGFSGNNQIGNYNYIGQLSPSNYVGSNSQIPGLVPSSLSNKNLGWERSEQINIGLDLGLFDNRISLIVDAYRDHKTDLLLNVQLPSASGFNSATQNIGDIENKGIEIALHTFNVSGEAFQWDTNFTFSANQNKVLKLAADGGRISMNPYQITEVGQPISSFYMLNAIGVFANSRELEGAALQHPNTQAGDLQFEDVNGDGTINSADRKIVGSPWPDYTWGLTNNLSYRNLSLRVNLVGSHGAETYFRWGTSVLNNAGVQNQLADISTQRWVSESSPGAGFQPRAIRSNYAMGFSDTSHFLFDSSFIRVKNIKLAYNFPQDLATNLGLTNLAVYLDGTNLYTFTDYPGYDPESSTFGDNIAASGIDYLTYPLARTYTAGINFSF